MFLRTVSAVPAVGANPKLKSTLRPSTENPAAVASTVVADANAIIAGKRVTIT